MVQVLDSEPYPQSQARYLTYRVPAGKLSHEISDFINVAFAITHASRLVYSLRDRASFWRHPGVWSPHPRHTAEKSSKPIVRSTDKSMCNSQSPRHPASISGSDESLRRSHRRSPNYVYSMNQPVTTARCSSVGLVHPPGSSKLASHIRASATRTESTSEPILSNESRRVPSACWDETSCIRLHVSVSVGGL